MRTKGPLLLMAVFLILLGAFIMWGATILFAIAVPPGVLFVLLSLFCTGFGIYFIVKVVKHFSSVADLIHGRRSEYMKLDRMTGNDIGTLEQELVSVQKWVRRNFAFGICFLLISCTIPTKFLGLHSFAHSLGHGGGNEPLVMKTGGLILFLFVAGVELFLLRNAFSDRKNIQKDLQEQQKIKLPGVVRGIEVEKFNKHKGTLVVKLGHIELEHEIDPVDETQYASGSKVELVLALHSQTILEIVPVN